MKSITTAHTSATAPFSAESDEAYWRSLREEIMLDPAVVYLNNGSYGPSPKSVYETVIEHMKLLESQPFYHIGQEFPRRVKETKRKLGEFVGAEADDMALVMNLTVGMNMIARGLDLKEGDEVVMTDQEYGAVNNCWDYLAQRNGFSIKRPAIPTPPESEGQIVEIIANTLTDNTKVIALSHITTTTELIMPLKAICKLARERGILTAIDGAHAPGMIPIDLHDINCDFYAGNCHKWLLSPKGTAFLYVRRELHSRLEPLVIGWGLSWDEKRRGETSDLVRLFEALGTRDMSPFIAIGAAVDFQNAIGKERIADRGRSLAHYVRERVKEIPGAYPLVSPKPELAGSMISFAMPTITEQDLMTELWEKYKIQIIGRPMNARETRTRVSTHFYNTRDDVDALFKAIHEVRQGSL